MDLFKRFYFNYTVVILLLLLLGLAYLPGIVLVGAFLILAMLNTLGREGYERNYITLILIALFYNAYSGDLLGFDFEDMENEVTMASIANYLAFFILIFILIRGRKLSFSFNIIDKLILIYSIWLIITTVTSVFYDVSLRELTRLPSFLALYFFTRLYFGKAGSSKIFLDVCYGIIFVISIFAGYKIYIGEYYGTLGVFVFFIALAVFMSVRGGLNLFTVRMIILIFSSASLLVAESRRVLISIGVIWLFSVFGNSKRFILFIPVLLIFNFIINTIDKQGEGRYHKTVDQLQDVNELSFIDQESFDRLGTGRGTLWSAALDITFAYPLFGTGVGGMKQLMPNYGNVGTQRAHNILLEIAAQLGVIGLLIFGFLNFYTFRKLRRVSKKLKLLNQLYLSRFAMAVFLGIMVVLIAALFGGSMLFEKWAWIQYGIVASLLETCERFIRNAHSKSTALQAQQNIVA